MPRATTFPNPPKFSASAARLFWRNGKNTASSDRAMKIRLLMLGKTRRPELRAIFDDYVKRISRSCPIETTEVRDADAAIKRLDADRAATSLLLDAAGKQHDSGSLAKWLGEQRDRGTREVIFICGDA